MYAACRFFDTGTRAILFQFVVYNTNTRQLTNVRLLIEQFMSADLQMSYQFETARVEVYASRTDTVRHCQCRLRAVNPPAVCSAAGCDRVSFPRRLLH